MSILSRLFSRGGGGEDHEVTPEDYEGYLIHPEPVDEGEHWRIAARIEKEIDGALQSHHLVRADTAADAEAAAARSIAKAKQLIDEQGEAIFRTGR